MKSGYFKNTRLDSTLTNITYLISVTSNCLLRMTDGKQTIRELPSSDKTNILIALNIKKIREDTPLRIICFATTKKLQFDTHKYLEEVNNLIQDELKR